MDKKLTRLRRAVPTRRKIAELRVHRLTVNVAAATLVGKRVAEKAKAVGIELVAFDRSGFRYHGRVKALADAAREAGLKF